MSAMAELPHLDSVLSFSRGDPAPSAGEDRPADAEAVSVAHSDASSDYDDDDAGFEFAFAPPLAAAGHDADGSLAVADDLFAHGRILPAYPVWDRRVGREDANGELTTSSTAPPSPDSYCAWAPRSAPGSPAREFPKSASASAGDAARRSSHWRLRDLVAGRSHSDGKEKFVFLQPAASGSSAPSKMSSSSSNAVDKHSSKPSAPLQHGRKKKGKQAGAVTEMDMATAHRLFYSKQPAAGGDRRPQQQQSYIPYRPVMVGFFATAHALGRSPRSC